MGAPSDIVWGSSVQGNTDSRFGRIGIYITTEETSTDVTATIQVWFSTKYSCSDGASVTLKFNVGTDISAASTTVVTKIPISHPKADGPGWSTNNHTCLYTVTKTFTKTTSAQTYKVYASFSGIDMLPSKTMYDNKSITVPKLASYTVSYAANGGSGAPASQTKWHGIDLLLSSTKPTKTGHSFSSWLSSAQNKTYQPGKYYGYNVSTTMTAQWTANTYAVTYDANGGSGAPASQVKTYGKTLTLRTETPTRDNYNFLGWAKSASDASAKKVSYQAGANYTANAALTLYAVWEVAYVKPSISGVTVARCDANGTYGHLCIS